MTLQDYIPIFLFLFIMFVLGYAMGYLYEEWCDRNRSHPR